MIHALLKNLQKCVDNFCQNKQEISRSKMYPISDKETAGKFKKTPTTKINFILKLFRIISLYLNPLVYVLFSVCYFYHYNSNV